MKFEELQLKNNLESHRFELQIDKNIAFIDYKLSRDLLFLIHTEVPVPLQGIGAAGAIVQKTLQFAKEHNYKIVPLCSYIQSYLEKHPEWRELISSDADRFIHKT